MPQLRPELTQLPRRLQTLRIDERGYPVPWFVAWINGKPEFRAADAAKRKDALERKLCWVCGGYLGTRLAFVLGPMCTITRTTSEPPCHRECAEWSAVNCPFLARPHMVRRDNNLPEEAIDAAGISIPRNPGVTCVWITFRFKIFLDDDRRPLIEVSDPLETSWWAEGRPATRQEVERSISSGLPILKNIAEGDGPEAVQQLLKQVEAARIYLPA